MIRTKKRRKANMQTRPATPPPKPVEPSDGPVFEAKWSDGTETRMSVYSSLIDLDVRRGIALAEAAGAEIDNALITMHAQAISAMVRVGARLGLARRSKPVMSTLGELIRREQEAERERLAREREAVL
jgi:hypothetical protein